MRLSRSLLRSASFRLALFYSLLTLVTMLAMLLIVHWGTSSLLEQRTERQISADVEKILNHFEDVNFKKVKKRVKQVLARNGETDIGVYLLIDKHGKRAVGNLDRMPAADSSADLQDAFIPQFGNSVPVRYVSYALPDGSTLLVGRNLREQKAFARLLAYTSLFAAVAALLLLVGGSLMFHRQMQRCVGEIRRITARIAEGSLQERIVLSGGNDEFARLEADINEMLDRIQALMLGVHHASNMIAHNLRTPFQHILVSLRDAQGEQVADAQRREAVVATIAKVEDLCRVFDKLLGIAEAQACVRRRQFSALALDEVINDVAELYEVTAEGQGIRLICGPLPPTSVCGDRDLLAMALANLVENALKYAGSGATVRLGIEQHGDRVHLLVQDNGPGIPESERVVRYFHRLHSDRPGHGLGLVYVEAVTTLHGGKLRLSDAAPGLRVCIDLPAAGGAPGA